MTVKAIETSYAGCRFRSRLEARAWHTPTRNLSYELAYTATRSARFEYGQSPGVRR